MLPPKLYSFAGSCQTILLANWIHGGIDTITLGGQLNELALGSQVLTGNSAYHIFFAGSCRTVLLANWIHGHGGDWYNHIG